LKALLGWVKSPDLWIRAALGLLLLSVGFFMSPKAEAYSLSTMLTPGWSRADAMTYASSTTLTVSGDKLYRYQPGQKVRLVQSAALKYFIVTAEPTYNSTTKKTTITLDGMGVYTLANAAITYPMYSTAWMPHDFPEATVGSYTTGLLRGVEVTAPGVAPANGFVLFAKDNGAGKTQLCAQFATGTAVCFATEV